MKIATAGSRTSKRWRTQDITWDGVLSRLVEPLRTGESFAEYQRMTREEQGRRKEAAGGFVGGALSGGRRAAGAVTERWLITLDADLARPDDWDNACALLDCAMAVYSTHSHSPDRPRLRWLIPLRAPVAREAYQPLARRVALELGILETLDASTYQPERLMYWPTAAQDGAYLFLRQDGPLLDGAAVLAGYGPGDAWKDSSLWPIASRERELVRREAKRQADPREKPGVVGAFCRAYDVPAAIDAFLPGLYTPAGPGRYTYAPGTTAAGAVLYEDGAFLYSNHASDPCGGMLVNAFDLVRVHKFGEQDQGQEGTEGTEGAKLPSYQAMTRWAAELPAVRRLWDEERQAKAEQDFADLAEAGPDSAVRRTESGGDDDWVDKLTVNHKTGETDPTIGNALLILERDPVLAGAVAQNQFSGRPVLRRDVPWRREHVEDPMRGLPWADADDAGLRLWLETRWHLRGRQVIQDAWMLTCARNAYHPVKQYLDTLRWDGTERLDTMLVRWLGAEDTPYVRAATRKWMCAAVARALRPGLKFDAMLVLVGEQGLGKSKLAMTLSKGWFTDSLTTLSGKDAYEGLRNAWIVELAELAAAKRSEVETIKNFISKQEDTYRPAYGRHVVTFPRQCVFYGTTNDPYFLKDRSGNRRFWPVEVEGIDQGRLRGLEAEVDQLWAEAQVRLDAGETLWMDTDELGRLAREAQAEFTEEDELVGIIQEYLDTPLPDNWYELPVEDRRDFHQGRSMTDPEKCSLRRDFVSVTEIRVEALGQRRQDVAQGNNFTSRRIADIMARMPGWKRTGKLRRLRGYGPQRVFVRVTARSAEKPEQAHSEHRR